MSAGPQPIPALAQNSGATHLAFPDWLSMPTDRFLLILGNLERRQKPHGEWCLVALSLFLAFLFPLVTTEKFRALLGVKPETWEALFLLGGFVSGALTLGFSARWIFLKIKRPSKTAEQILQDVVDQMTKERDRAKAGYAAAGPAAASDATGSPAS